MIQHRNDKLQGSLPQEAFRMADTHVTTARHTSVLQQNQLLNLIESGTHPMLHTKVTKTEALNQLSAKNGVVTHISTVFMNNIGHLAKPY
jgi:hypothetical protein